MKTKLLYILYVFTVLAAPVLAVTVSIPGGGVDLASALTWAGTQTFTDMNATDQIGLGSAWATGDADVDVDATLRVSGASGTPSSGTGLEFAFVAPDSYIVAYNRTGGAYSSLVINGAPTSFNPNGAYSVFGGQVGLYSRTSAQLNALAPQAAGYIAFNSTNNKVCVSTGTGAGAWVQPDDGSTACD